MKTVRKPPVIYMPSREPFRGQDTRKPLELFDAYVVMRGNAAEAIYHSDSYDAHQVVLDFVYEERSCLPDHDPDRDDPDEVYDYVVFKNPWRCIMAVIRFRLDAKGKWEPHITFFDDDEIRLTVPVDDET